MFLAVVLGIVFIDAMCGSFEYFTRGKSLILNDIFRNTASLTIVPLYCIAVYGIYKARKQLKLNKSTAFFFIVESLYVLLIYNIILGNRIYSGEEGIVITTPISYTPIELDRNSILEHIFGTFIVILGYSRSLFVAMSSLPFYILVAVNKDKQMANS